MLKLVAKLPWPAAHAMATAVAYLMDNLVRYRRTVVTDNLSKCFPDLPPENLRVLRRAFYQSLADTAFETVKSAGMNSEEIRRRVTISNASALEPFIREAQPLMIIGSHQANWEWIFLACSDAMTLPVEGVYQPLHNAWFDRQMANLRTRFGARLIPDRNALQDVIKHLKVPRIVTMVADQHPPRKAPRYWTTFLGRETVFYTGWAKLAQATRYPVFYAHRERTARGHYNVTLELLSEPPHARDTNALVESYVRALERSIQTQPATWLWSHRRWRDHKPLYQ